MKIVGKNRAKHRHQASSTSPTASPSIFTAVTSFSQESTAAAAASRHSNQASHSRNEPVCSHQAQQSPGLQSTTSHSNRAHCPAVPIHGYSSSSSPRHSSRNFYNQQLHEQVSRPKLQPVHHGQEQKHTGPQTVQSPFSAPVQPTTAAVQQFFTAPTAVSSRSKHQLHLESSPVHGTITSSQSTTNYPAPTVQATSPLSIHEHSSKLNSPAIQDRVQQQSIQAPTSTSSPTGPESKPQVQLDLKRVKNLKR